LICAAHNWWCSRPGRPDWGRCDRTSDGLRCALVLAGAQAQLVSLRKVADAQTQTLMVDYYQRLLKGARALAGIGDDCKPCNPPPLLLRSAVAYSKLMADAKFVAIETSPAPARKVLKNKDYPATARRPSCRRCPEAAFAGSACFCVSRRPPVRHGALALIS
jgi:hypothetical protein